MWDIESRRAAGALRGLIVSGEHCSALCPASPPCSSVLTGESAIDLSVRISILHGHVNCCHQYLPRKASRANMLHTSMRRLDCNTSQTSHQKSSWQANPDTTHIHATAIDNKSHAKLINATVPQRMVYKADRALQHELSRQQSGPVCDKALCGH